MAEKAKEKPKFTRWYRRQAKVKKTYSQLRQEYGQQKREKEETERKKRREKRGFGKSRLRELAGKKGRMGL